MERLEKREWLALAALFLATVLLLGFLPFSGLNVFLSPDETGVFVAAKQWAEQGTASIDESLARAIPWLHARSWISHNASVVPVGFLGWPWIITWFIKILGTSSAAVAAMLIIASCIYPMYRLLRPIGKAPAFIAIIVAITSPAFLLYGNRSLFPNAAILSLSIWCAWVYKKYIITTDNPSKSPLLRRETSGSETLLRRMERQEWVKFVLFGVLSGLTLAIRPVEAVWIIPWFIVMGWNWRPSAKQALWIVLGIFIALVPMAWQAQFAYGGFWKAGYWMKGNSVVVTTTASAPQNIYAPELFPFGIHPKSIAWNSYVFLGMTLFPWMVPLLMMLALVVIGIIKGETKLSLKERTLKFVRSDRGKIVLVSLWTFLFLVLYYGNGRYLDNILGTAAIGNSFIRYLLPLGFLSGLALAWIYRLAGIAKYGRTVVIVMTVLLAFTGIWRAYAADAEGLIAGRAELKRYASIRESTAIWFKPGDIILSERSDKIFFPTYRGVSPLPQIDDASLLSHAVDQEVGIGLFVRPLAQSQADAWRKIGLEPIELASFGREKLYRLQPVKP